MKELKEDIKKLDDKLDKMCDKKMNVKERKEFDELNNHRYYLAKILEIEQLKAKVKRLEKENKKLKSLI